MTQNSSYPSTTAPNSTLAIVALIGGILGLTIFPFVGSIVAIIAGPMAKREIAESGGTIGGENLAQIGMILGWIGLALSLCGCVVGIGVFGLSFLMALFGISTQSYSLVLPALALI
jgi:hypothetical protein